MRQTPGKVRKLSRNVRSQRRIHRYLSMPLLILVVVSATTGILLSLKKEIEWLQPPTQTSKTGTIQDFIDLETVISVSNQYLFAIQGVTDIKVDRIDIRPQKGVAKVIYQNGGHEVQIDLSSGSVLSYGKRRSDWIEKLHDGSIVNDLFKVASMNVLGAGLLFLSFSGFIMWFFPKRIRRIKKYGT